MDPLKYQPVVKNDNPADNHLNEFLTIKVRYKDPDGGTSRLLTKTVSGPVKAIGEASADLRFAASVAEFGMILGSSEYTGNASFDSALNLARLAGGDDEDGYRSEFIRLVKTARDIQH